MSELGEKVKMSIERLKAFAPRNGEGYYLAFSGGKDSVVCKHLLGMAGIKFDAHYNVPSVDPPELVQFIKDKHPDVSRDIPHYPEDFRIEKLAGKPITMWNLIPWELMPPTRKIRYCCKFLKESGGDGRMMVTGVRWAESFNRRMNQGSVTIMGRSAGRELGDDTNFTQTVRGGVVLVNDNADSRRVVEQCYKRHKTAINPIIDWTDTNVWEFIRAEHVPYCGLYDCGFTRLGCIGCPLARKHRREIEFAKWPKYKSLYIRAFAKMLERLVERGRIDGMWRMGTTGVDVFRWWMEYDVLPGQVTFEEMEGEGGEV